MPRDGAIIFRDLIWQARGAQRRVRQVRPARAVSARGGGHPSISAKRAAAAPRDTDFVNCTAILNPFTYSSVRSVAMLQNPWC